ncbi:DHHC palmitoyltransferase-like protein [Sorochytrium milnesiophthora]
MATASLIDRLRRLWRAPVVVVASLYALGVAAQLSHSSMSLSMTVSMVLSGVLFILCCVSDPGYVATVTSYTAVHEGKDTEHSALWVGMTIDQLPPRSCPVCDINRMPVRSRHCNKCRRCVHRFDHHCFLIGNCVGQANHRLFVAMLLLFVWTMGEHLYHIVPPFMAGQTGYLALASMLTSLPFFLIVLGLSLYHLYLTASNQTTWENLRRHDDKVPYLPRELLLQSDLEGGGAGVFVDGDEDWMGNPFDRGVGANCWQFWSKAHPDYGSIELRPRTPSRLDKWWRWCF